MESARTRWNDDRLDDLATQVGKLEMRMDSRFDRLEARFDRLQASLFVTLGAILAAFGGALVAPHL